MKPAKFDYLRAESVRQAVAALDQEEGAAIVLAGGQTLVPMLSMRLARPDLVVEIDPGTGRVTVPVSYTHLTLPTKRIV